MQAARCPDCAVLIELSPRVTSGDVVECPNCAGLLLRVREDPGIGWSVTPVHRVSCPVCDGLITLPEEAKPGDLVTCCGREYRLTFEYGAFAAEDTAVALAAEPHAALARSDAISSP